MDRAFLTSRFSISLTSSLTWLRIFRQHSALCWIPSFSVGSSVDRQINKEMSFGGLSEGSVNKSKKSSGLTKKNEQTKKAPKWTEMEKEGVCLCYLHKPILIMRSKKVD